MQKRSSEKAWFPFLRFFAGIMKGRKLGSRSLRLLFAGVPVLLLFYLFTPWRPVQFFCFFLMLLILGSWTYSEYLARRLRIVRRDRVLRVFRYEWTGVELWVENTGRLPVFLLIAEDSSGGIAVFRNIKSLNNLAGRSRCQFCWDAYGTDRGVFTLGPASLRGADPLGLFPFAIISDETARLFVYPARAFAAIRSFGGIPLGKLIKPDPVYEDLTRPRSLRDYMPGDESKRINWKASARNSGRSAGTLLVNEYEPSLSYPLVIFLNVDPHEYAVKKRESSVERVIEAAAALCLMAAREKQTLGLIIHSGGTSCAEDDLSISPAAFTLIPVLERLAALEPFMAAASESRESSVPGNNPELRSSVRMLLEKAKALPFGSRLIYAGPALEEEDYIELETLRRRRMTLEYLIIDEKRVGNWRNRIPKYQIKEWGNEIL